MKRLFYYVSILLYLCSIILTGCSMFEKVTVSEQPTNTTSVVTFLDGTTYIFDNGRMYTIRNNKQ